uniref:Uncharacterized protein n=2 Tax=Sphaerodactylus townsendi TaxID=933632 RepID=A0ACB8FSZ8_9SAUR
MINLPSILARSTVQAWACTMNSPANVSSSRSHAFCGTFHQGMEPGPAATCVCFLDGPQRQALGLAVTATLEE